MSTTTPRYKILYLDDDRDLLELGKLFLERIQGFSVVTVDSPFEALEKIKTGSFDAVVSDYEMPGMNGIEVLRKVRESGLRIPLIIFTGRGREDVVIEALNSGADFYIQKGGEPKSQFAELEHKIKSAIERREAIDALRASREQLSEVISALPDPTFAIDGNHRVIAWNRAIEQISGISGNDMIGKGDYAYSVPFTGKAEPFIIDLILEKGIELPSQYPELRNDGEMIIAENHFHLPIGERYVRIQAGPLYSKDMQITGAIATIQDITDRFLAELELKNAVNVYQNVAEYAADWEYWENPEKQIIYCSPSVYLITGYRPDEFKKDPDLISGITYPDDRKIWDNHRHISRSSDKPDRIEMRIITRSGNLRWIEHVCTPVFGSNNVYIGHRVSNRDITERKRSEQELSDVNIHLQAVNQELMASKEAFKQNYTRLEQSQRELDKSEKKYRMLFENANDGILIIDGTKIITANKRTFEMFGSDQKSVIGRAPFEFSPVNQPDNSHSAKKGGEMLEKAINSGGILFEWQHMRVDGTVFDAEISLNPINLENERYILAIIRDITERNRINNELSRKNEDLCTANEEILSIEEELREQYTELALRSDLLRKSEERLSGIINEAPFGAHMFELNKENELIFTGSNPAADKILGFEHKKLIGKTIEEAFPEITGTEIPEKYRKIIQIGDYYDEERIIRDTGGIKGAYEIHAFQSGPDRIAEFFTDITKRKQGEEALIDSENRVRSTLNAILMTEGAMSEFSLRDLLDIEEIQSLIHDFSVFINIPVAILDLEGNILVASGWQDICTKFHRMHPESSKHCQESDLVLSSGIKDGSFKLYRCKNNLWDIAMPLIIGGEQVGNIFAGQIILNEEPMDYQLWRKQAQRYGFDEEEYIKALDRVPRWDRNTLNKMMSFYAKLTHLISRFSNSRLKLARSLTDQKRLTDQIRESEIKFRSMFINSPIGIELFDRDGKLIDINRSCLEIFGFESAEDVPGQDLWSDPNLSEDVRERVFKGENVKIEFSVDFDPVKKHAGYKTTQSGKRYLEQRITPISETKGGENLGYLVQILDISSRIDMEKALRNRIITLTQPLDESGGVQFSDLFDVEEIQKIQDIFAEATGVASIITMPDGTPITRPSNFCRLCGEIIRKTEKGLSNCYHSDESLGRCNATGPVIQPCLSGGLWDAGASITVGGDHIANWLIGQVRNEEQNYEQMLRYAEEIGADRESFREALAEVPVMSKEHFDMVAQALCSFANALSLTAYQNIQQARYINERRQAEDALKKANKQLHLLSSITRHDIHNKISAMAGYFELSKDIPKNTELDSFISKLEVLTFNIKDQIEFTGIYQDLGSQDPLWHDVREILPYPYLPSDISLEVNLSDFEVYADPILEKVFFVLLDNSLRHGERVTRTRVSSREVRDGMVIVWEDDGIGIPSGEKERIFERGYGKNTGLGLFLIREILDITGITIRECGIEGEGARFELIVPPEKFRYHL